MMECYNSVTACYNTVERSRFDFNRVTLIGATVLVLHRRLRAIFLENQSCYYNNNTRLGFGALGQFSSLERPFVLTHE